MKTIHLMLKPASSLCNMRCRYCFYADVSAMRTIPSYGIMSEESARAIVQNLLAEAESGDRIHITFQGGEPVLAGLPFFRRFVSLASARRDVQLSYAIQTNGLLLDEEWCDFLREHRFLTGISLDILPQAHDAARVDALGEGTYKRVLKNMTLLKRCGVEFNVLCTLTAAVARHPTLVWNQLVKLGIDYTQFTPCLGALEGEMDSPYTLTPQLFASFYTQLFDHWYADYRAGRRRSIKLFDDVVNQAVLGRPTGCGMDGTCRPQLVTEADGSVYPCDFYCLDEYRLGNITSDSIADMLRSPALTAFMQRPKQLPSLCGECRYRTFCGGNCPRMRREICCDSAENFCGYKSFLDRCGGTLFALAAQIRQSLRKS